MAPAPRPGWKAALREAGVLPALAGFDPHLAGTPPLRLDLPGSDIDVLCHAPDGQAFAERLWTAFAARDGFALRQWVGRGHAVIATFRSHGWEFEVFGLAEPVATQAGWRHLVIERRLLALGGARLRARVAALRRQGLKTEPAFAATLGLPGDPYAALLALEKLSRRDLLRLIDNGLAHS